MLSPFCRFAIADIVYAMIIALIFAILVAAARHCRRQPRHYYAITPLRLILMLLLSMLPRLLLLMMPALPCHATAAATPLRAMLHTYAICWRCHAVIERLRRQLRH